MGVLYEFKEGDNPEDVLDECKDKKVVCYFTASWCGPCQRIAPEFKKLAEGDEYPDMVFMKIDVDEFEDFCGNEGHNIRAMPTFKFFNKGELVDELTGARLSDLVAKVAKLSTQ